MITTERPLARRYARRCSRSAPRAAKTDKIGADVKALAAAMKESSELSSLLSSPAIRRSERRKVIDTRSSRGSTSCRSPSTSSSCCSITNSFVALPAIARETDAI